MMKDSARLLTMLLVRTKPSARPFALGATAALASAPAAAVDETVLAALDVSGASGTPRAVAISERVSFDRKALMKASDFASTVTLPAALMSEFLMYARICAGCSSPIWLPTRASMAENRTFCASQPTVLKARVAPILVPSEVIALELRATMCAEFMPSTVRSPSVVSIALSSIQASAVLRTRLVAITPPTARPSPSPPEASAVLSTFALMIASSVADTLTEPASTSARRIAARAEPLTSLRTTTPPTAMGRVAAAGSSGKAGSSGTN